MYVTYTLRANMYVCDEEARLVRKHVEPCPRVRWKSNNLAGVTWYFMLHVHPSALLHFIQTHQLSRVGSLHLDNHKHDLPSIHVSLGFLVPTERVEKGNMGISEKIEDIESMSNPHTARDMKTAN